MALSPNEAGSHWRGDRDRGLSHEEVSALGDMESEIDAKLRIKDPEKDRYTVPFRHPTKLREQCLPVLRDRYRDKGWEVRVWGPEPPEAGAGVIYKIELTRPL